MIFTFKDGAGGCAGWSEFPGFSGRGGCAGVFPVVFVLHLNELPS